MFRDRTDAGRHLANALKSYRGANPLVLGLPRGGVVVGAEVARALGGELDVLLVKKLRAPGNPELALGAVCEDGHVHLNPMDVSDAYVQKEIVARRAEMMLQQQRYRAVRPRVPRAGRTVILVDDGLATGATMMAGVQTTQLAKPVRLIVAVPVSPPETAREFNDLVCLETPLDFQGVGQFYEDFTQVEDDEVIRILKEFA
jgi:putative phosphoribosyl transferase